MSDLASDFSQTHMCLLNDDRMPELEEYFAVLEKQARESLARQGVAEAAQDLHRSLECRYLGQEHSLDVPITQEASATEIRRSFDALHEARYGHKTQDAIQVVTLRVGAAGKMEKPQLASLPKATKAVRAALSGTRKAYCFARRNLAEFAIYNRALLAPGHEFQGPAIIDEGTSNTVVTFRPAGLGRPIRPTNYHGEGLMKLDGAIIEVIRSYLHSAAEEMRRTLVRTAFNPVIYEVLDFGISIYNRKLEMIAHAPGLAFFLGANDYAIRKGVEYIGEQNFEPGDIALMNYPYWNSAHAMDVTLFAPVFFPGGNRPFAYTCIRAHWMDLGAKDPGYVLDSTDMHQEGLIFPGTKVYKRGHPDKEILLKLIRFNSRMPDLVLGDLDAQVASTRTGERRLQEIHKKFGEELLEEATQKILGLW